jgi:alpha/beta superfamily hydrolase
MSASHGRVSRHPEAGAPAHADANGRERPFFVEHEAGQFYCVFYQRLALGESEKGIVLCPPYPWEYQGCDRLFVGLARQLAEAGVDVIRFDYSGNRESSGSPYEAGLDTQLADIERAIDELQSLRPGDSIGLLGARAGATLAALAADQDSRVEFLILWDPIAVGKRHMTRCLRAAVASQSIGDDDGRPTSGELSSRLERGESVELAGFVLSAKLYRDWLGTDAVRQIQRWSIPCLVLETCAGQRARDSNLAALAGRYTDAHDAGRLAVADEPPYWAGAPPFGVIDSRRALVNETLSWLAERT